MQTLTGKVDRYLTLLPLWSLLLIYILLLSLIAVFAYKKKWLTLSGAVSAVILGLIVLWMGGVSAFTVFLFFFVSSSLVSKLSKFVNRREKKGNRRDMVQVLANGRASCGTVHTSYQGSVPVTCFHRRLFRRQCRSCCRYLERLLWSNES